MVPIVARLRQEFDKADRVLSTLEGPNKAGIAGCKPGHSPLELGKRRPGRRDVIDCGISCCHHRMGGADGGTLLSVKVLSGPLAGWRIVGAADQNVDGHPDLVWQQDGTNVPALWYM